MPEPVTLCAQDSAYKKGDLVMYTYKSQPLFGDDGEEIGEVEDIFDIATIVGVHLDDFPNVYYTIQYTPAGGVSRERQTTSTRLRLCTINDPMVYPSTKSGGGGSANGNSAQTEISMTAYSSRTSTAPLAPMSFKVKSGSVTYTISDVDSTITVLQVKMALSAVTGVPTSRQKLIIKGSYLKDAQFIISQSSKVTRGCTVTLMGTK